MGTVRRIHMVGIGGIGMSSIAEVLINRGFQLSGSDLKKSDVTARLEELGAVIHEGHAAEHVENADVVVYSSAVRDPAENPETAEARRRLIPIIKRSEMLGELMRAKRGVGIAGTHGKTTTTTMVGLVAQHAELDPTIIVGGKVAVFGSNAVAGGGEVIVVEADEYDRTFLRLAPIVAVVTNIEADHLDIYEDLDDIKQAFVQFANSVPFFGAAILCLDDENVRSVLGQIHRPVRTYGTSRQASLRAENIEQVAATTQFDVYEGSERLGGITLHAPGLHNVRNALAAVAVGLELGVDFPTISSGLGQYQGVDRRFQVKGEAAIADLDGASGTVLVVDDYAHHPTEVEATLMAAARGWPDRRIVAVFQPHLYSRTRDLAEDFARAFYDADVLVLTDIFPARETPIEGVTGEMVADLARQFGHRDVHYVEDKAAISDYLGGIVHPGDLVVTMGAGDIYRYGDAFLASLGGPTDASPAS
ncbi:UDP-N-acetylmuramate--L-alanine ligase [Rubrivirga sp. IMCC45206]|uniref:UDP-N-acetylmuramate--L-alanine ligase n=1 Tax=Rubrivirga sp. IMCC45206 TaxID=3391614 RepID=UPI00398FF6E9